MWAFGDGYHGQLGYGNTEDQATPKQIEGITSIVAIAAGRSHTVLLDENGEVWSFGHGQYGRLGHGDNKNQVIPTRIEVIPSIALPRRGSNTKSARKL